MLVGARDHAASFDSRSRSNFEFAFPTLICEPCGNAARTVSRYFRLGTIRIQQMNCYVGLRVRGKPFDTVGADAVVSITNFFGPQDQVFTTCVLLLNQQEVIATRRGLHKRNWF